MTPRETLIALAIKNKGDFSKILQDIQGINDIDTKALEQIALYTQCITYIDADYPNIMKQGYRPPMVLFYKGDKELLKAEKTVSFIGKREPHIESSMFLDSYINNKLPQDYVVYTTLACGIGTTATISALNNGNKVVAILPSGIDNCYPRENRDLYDRILASGGLIISEYPGMTEAQPANFVARNRIIASLANNICSIDADNRSGSSMLISFALNNGKTIYALPHISESEDFNNSLIEEGANCLTMATVFDN